MRRYTADDDFSSLAQSGQGFSDVVQRRLPFQQLSTSRLPVYPNCKVRSDDVLTDVGRRSWFVDAETHIKPRFDKNNLPVDLLTLGAHAAVAVVTRTGLVRRTTRFRDAANPRFNHHLHRPSLGRRAYHFFVLTSWKTCALLAWPPG